MFHVAHAVHGPVTMLLQGPVICLLARCCVQMGLPHTGRCEGRGGEVQRSQYSPGSDMDRHRLHGEQVPPASAVHLSFVQL